jgi:hypothetical protein
MTQDAAARRAIHVFIRKIDVRREDDPLTGWSSTWLLALSSLDMIERCRQTFLDRQNRVYNKACPRQELQN